MKEWPLVSVIVPFYNEERFLKRAIDSSINQSYPSLEIILVDDGSTDDSAQIAKQYQKDYSNIILLNTAQLGPGTARNIGVKNASGEYIIFLDADDELSLNTIEKMYDNLIVNDSDISICLHSEYTEENVFIKQFEWKKTVDTLNSAEAISWVVNQKIIPTVWGKLFKKSVMKNHTFPNISWREDDVFLLRYLSDSDCNTISLLNESLIKMNCRSVSLTRQAISEKKVRDMYTSFMLQLQLMKEKKLPRQEYDLVNHQISFFFRIFMVMAKDWKKYVQVNKQLKSLFLEKIDHFSSVFDDYPMSLKNQLFVKFMLLPKCIGWSIPIYSIKIIKRKRIKVL